MAMVNSGLKGLTHIDQAYPWSLQQFAISVLPYHLHLSEVKQGRVKCLALGYSLETNSIERGETYENHAHSGYPNLLVGCFRASNQHPGELPGCRFKNCFSPSRVMIQYIGEPS